MAFANLTANLQLNIANFSSGLNNASRQLGRFASNMQQSYSNATRELKSHNLGLKDTARIVQGIVISQTFYAATSAIASATRSLWDFNTALDYMHVTYSALFGDTKVASDFMSALQEHSIETIFDYQSLADASKKLLAYGIEYENLMFIMEGLTNLGAMSGDAAALDRISLALGQIFTKGTLDATEMKQLANAYIPITEILQDKFGLTGDDLDRVADLNLPAANVINAIVDYANENFASVGDAAMYTITGLQNKIVDTLKVVGAQMLKPITTAYKSFLAYISSGLEVLRGEFAAGGVGGIFEYLVPDQQTQQVIRQFIANVKNLFMALVSVGTVAGRVFGSFASVLVTAFNIVSPIVVGFVNVLAAVLNSMLQTRTGATLLSIALVAAAGAFVVLKVQAAAALVVTAVTKAVVGLSKALILLASIITKHPILALLTGLAISLVGVSMASSTANKSISGLFDTISGAAGGTASSDVLQKVEQGLTDSAGAADQFNNRLNNATQAAKDLSKAIGGTGSAADKAAKKAGLLSFDEVFKLNEPADDKGGSGGGAADGLLGDLSDLVDGFSGLGDSLIPDIPDFSDFISEFTDGLFGGLSDALVLKLRSAGIGALIGGTLGAIFGGILGGPGGVVLGAKIGAFAGGVVGILWEEMQGAMTNTFAGLGAGIARAIAGALKSAGAAGLGTIIKNAFAEGGFKGVWSALGGVLKTTGAKALLKGGVVGAVVGIFTDGLAHLLWSDLDEKFANANAETAKVGQTIGSVIGMILGGLLGGPVGAVIGSAVGTFAGGFIGLFWEPIKTGLADAFWGFMGWMNNIGEAYDVWRVNFEDNVNAAIDNAIIAIGKFISDSFWSFMSWINDVGAAYDTWRVNFENTINTAIDNTIAAIGTWIIDSFNSISKWIDDTVGAYNDWAERTEDAINVWVDNTVAAIGTWITDTISAIGKWASDVAISIATWASNTLTSIGAWASNSWNSFINWSTNVGKVLTDFFANALSKVGKWLSDMFTNMSTWFSNTKTSIANWWHAMFNPNNWKVGWSLVIKWFADTFTSMSNWFTNTKTSITTWWNGLFDPSKWKSGWTSVKSWFSTLLTDIANWFNSVKTSINSWWDGLFDDKEVTVNTSSSSTGVTVKSDANGYNRVYAGHASGGVFNREHIARFAEGNKAEAIIPLENASAMQPFVDAVSNGIVSSLAPVVAMAGASNGNNLQPLYVGTLVADERGLRELYKRFEVIQVQEHARRGTLVEVF